MWWLQHTVKSAFQPLVFIHVIYIRCYETDVAEIAMHTALISLAVYEKGRENKKKLHRYRSQNIWGRQSYPAVPMGTYQPGTARHTGHLCTHQIDQAKEENRNFGLGNDCWGWIMCQLKPSAGCCYRDFGLHNGPTPKQGRYGGTASQIKPNLSDQSTPPHQSRSLYLLNRLSTWHDFHQLGPTGPSWS